MTKRYVYLLRDPRKEDFPPFYVGIGVRRRAWSHWDNFVTKGIHSNPLMFATLTAILSAGLEPHVEIFGLFESSEAQQWEITLIAKYGRKFNGSGILCNVTSGGDGSDSATMRELWKNPAYRSMVTKAVKEGLAKSEARKAYTTYLRSPEGRAMCSQRIKAAITDITKGKISKAATLQMASPEARAKESARMKEAWSKSPERFANVGSPEASKKRSEAMKAFWADPEKRAARCATMSLVMTKFYETTAGKIAAQATASTLSVKFKTDDKYRQKVLASAKKGAQAFKLKMEKIL